MDTKNDLLFNHSLIKVVRIIGCDYKLRECEILDWLVQFGEVSSEITEEAYGDVEAQETMNMPPVGNGTYRVTMKLKKDLPKASTSWVGCLLTATGVLEMKPKPDDGSTALNNKDSLYFRMEKKRPNRTGWKKQSNSERKHPNSKLSSS